MDRTILGIIFLLCIRATKIYSLENYRVLKIHDDSSITVRDNLASHAFRFSLNCLEIPDLKQEPWGQKLQNRIKELLMNDTKITLKLGHDQFERNTADVYLSTGVNLAEKLLEEGLAVVSPDPDRCINYRSIESKATNNRIGVWSDSNFVLPFIWRQNQKE